MIKGKAVSPVAAFVRMLGKCYSPENAQGTRKIMEVLILASVTSPQEVRQALRIAQEFLPEQELAELWKAENAKASTARPSLATASFSTQTSFALEMDDVAQLTPKSVATVLTQLRRMQLISLDPLSMVRFAMISPDPIGFELCKS